MKKEAGFHRAVFFVFLVAAMLLLAPVLAATAGRGIVPVPVKDMGGKEVMLYKESHALVIGVSEYTSGWPRLPGVTDDVREVTKVLEDRGFDVTVALNPDREGLEKAFNGFINKHGRGRDNRLLFYFAGHGYTRKAGYGGEMGYIVPADAPDPNRDEAGFLSKAMDMTMFEVYAKRVEAKHALFLFDSCFSGSLFALSRAIPEVIQEKTSKPARQFITAGTAEQTVPDRSIFRDQFVRALRGEADLNKDGYVTASELGQFLEDTVTNYSRRSQTPQYGKLPDPHLDKGDFVFSLGGAIAPRKSADLEQERRTVETERLRVEEERKRREAENRLADERRKLEEERQKLARLEPPKTEPGPQTSGQCPSKMAFIPAGRLASENVIGEMPVGGFCMDKYEVTQAEYEKVMGRNPSYFKGGNLPAESVTWHEADAYCKKAGKRLPTEWEWEYAARGGTTTEYHWGDSEAGIEGYAWFMGNSENKTHAVGEKKPNQYGLYDMAGNVWEWTASDYDNSGKKKVLRSGAWNNIPYASRAAFRASFDLGSRDSLVGFRCAQ